MVEDGKRLLFIADTGEGQGSDRFRAVLRQVRVTSNWELRGFIRKRQGSLDAYREILPTKFFYVAAPPPEEDSPVPSNWRAFLHEAYCVAIRRYGSGAAAFRYRKHLARRWMPRVQAAYEAALRQEMREWLPDFVYTNSLRAGDVIEKLGLPSTPLVMQIASLDGIETIAAEERDGLLARPDAFLAASEALKQRLVEELSVPPWMVRVAADSHGAADMATALRRLVETPLSPPGAE